MTVLYGLTMLDGFTHLLTVDETDTLLDLQLYPARETQNRRNSLKYRQAHCGAPVNRYLHSV
jgi:hypothetical protein